jgi:hypothetical protein
MSDRFIVATRKGLFTVERSGSSARVWTLGKPDFLGDSVSYAMADPRDGYRYAALQHGHFGAKLHRSPGWGNPWEEVAVPVYPKQPEGEIDKDMMGRLIPWSLVAMWVIEPGAASEPGVLWTGTLPGGLFRSRDRGSSWELMRSLWDNPTRKFWMGGGYDVPGINSVCVDPRAAATLRVGISSGGVWLTNDAGATWTPTTKGLRADYVPPELVEAPASQDVHRLVQSPSDPDTLWIQHHNGIFVTRNGGAQWSEIKSAGPSTFGFTTVVHPADAATAWFVPAIKDEKRVPVDGRMVVTRTRDGGKTFEVLSQGLPQTNAYHLVYRHCLAIDATGRRLAMGSTTGGLWVSEDEGESWTCICQDVPPIHGVRFAS